MRKKAFPTMVLVILLLVVGIVAWFVWKNNNNTAVEITLYFANDRYIQSGDVNEPQVIPEKRAVRPGGRSLPEIVMEELIAGPNTEGLSTVLSNLEVLGVEVRDDIAYVDFSKNNLYGGSLTETLLIEQTVRSLIELEDVQAVQFLVEGAKEESLMGHIQVTDPIRP